MRLMVLTCAVWPSQEVANKKAWIFLKSCEKFGITPTMYGVGHPWTIYRHIKLDLQYEFLRDHAGDYTHVLYTDSQDAFFLSGIDEIVEKYRAYGEPPILASASHQLANVSNEKLQYPDCFKSPAKYRFPHVGGYLAEIPAIVSAFNGMLNLERQTSDDCFNWFDAWQEGWFRPVLDYRCDIFQATTEDCVMGASRLVNTHTNSCPSILHICGGYNSQETGKDDRLIPWAKKVGIL